MCKNFKVDTESREASKEVINRNTLEEVNLENAKKFHQ